MGTCGVCGATPALTCSPHLLQNTDLFEMIEKMQVRWALKPVLGSHRGGWAGAGGSVLAISSARHRSEDWPGSSCWPCREETVTSRAPRRGQKGGRALLTPGFLADPGPRPHLVSPAPIPVEAAGVSPSTHPHLHRASPVSQEHRRLCRTPMWSGKRARANQRLDCRFRGGRPPPPLPAPSAPPLWSSRPLAGCLARVGVGRCGQGT